MRIIENRILALKQMTEELFRYSVVISTPGELAPEEVEVNRILEDSVSAYYAVLRGCGITPDISLPDRPVVCRANAAALSRVFANILSNAVKYSSGDLRITLAGDGELTFANHAPELDEITAGKLFDRFYTVESAARSTGLGLSIARTLMEQMGGSISARYADGMLCLYLHFLPLQ